MLVTVIGRGHSGTRAISQTLSSSGVFMGDRLNESGDLVPPGGMYRASRILSRHVRWLGGVDWDWSALETMPIPSSFENAVRSYLSSPLDSTAPHRGWKLPETTLCYPWIRRMFPEVRYVFWIRNPRDCILGRHMTDDLSRWGIGCPPTDDDRLRRAFSWFYQYKIVKAVPRPEHWIEIRFEDFVLDQTRTLERLEKFLGIPLAPIPVKPEAVGRYRTDKRRNYFDFLEPAMHEYAYPIPDRLDPARAPPIEFNGASRLTSLDPLDASRNPGTTRLLAFENVPIMPYTDLPHRRMRGQVLHRGGPIWPDWDSQIVARHCRRGEPIDVPPAFSPCEEIIDEPVAWAGAIVPHFGHQIGDFSGRIVTTRLERPDIGFVFAVNPSEGIVSLESAPRFFAELLAWLGVASRRFHVVVRPTLARHLLVAPQAEQLGGLGRGHAVDTRYLDALDELTFRRLGRPRRQGTLYVSRAGQRVRPAGESEIEAALSRAGVDVFRPEEAPLAEQLKRYACAERLVFAEGSAVHGVQLLGRALGDVRIVIRRPGSSMGTPFVRPRAKSFGHLDFGLRLVHGLSHSGTVPQKGVLTLLDEERLVDGWETMGIPLRRHWDGHAFHLAVERDVSEWLTWYCSPSRARVPGSADLLRETLTACGLGHFVPVVDATLKRPTDERHRMIGRPPR